MIVEGAVAVLELPELGVDVAAEVGAALDVAEERLGKETAATAEARAVTGMTFAEHPASTPVIGVGLVRRAAVAVLDELEELATQHLHVAAQLAVLCAQLIQAGLVVVALLAFPRGQRADR